MPKVRQRYEEPAHTVVDAPRLNACSLPELAQAIARCECVECLSVLMELGRKAENRFYELP